MLILLGRLHVGESPQYKGRHYPAEIIAHRLLLQQRQASARSGTQNGEESVSVPAPKPVTKELTPAQDTKVPSRSE
ncbi:hypothetical protein [Streptomyces sp. NPDC020298]|uniref:hypothetical protein n=1 Tax=unclassified Streptomyces TaxID=2593676 RepID=UPI0033DDF90E